MHSRILHRLSDAESTTDCAIGECSLSYYSNREGSLDNLIIFGNASAYAGPLGSLNSQSGYYEFKVRIHGRNIMGGEEFAELIKAHYSDINYSQNGSLFEFGYSSVSEYGDIINGSIRYFKPNTVYTFRFHFIGGKQSSTGIRVAYDDGSYEDILAGDTNDCDIAFHSARGKTLSFVRLSNISVSSHIIDLSTFGIFEGELDYDTFEEYSGSVYTISTSSCYCGQDGDYIPVYDTFEWKSKLSTLRLRRVMIDKSNIYLYQSGSLPIVQVNLPSAINQKRPSVQFHTYTQMDSLEEIRNTEYAYTIADEETLYMTPYYDIYNYITEFNTAKALIYARDKSLFVKEKMCMDMPSVPAGYIGIEVYGNVSPKKIMAYYKK